jgi:Mn-dependent DtxR family transcriptional regulator
MESGTFGKHEAAEFVARRQLLSRFYASALVVDFQEIKFARAM